MASVHTAGRREAPGVIRLARETIAELRKVNWPTRQEAMRMTGLVLAVVAVTGAILGLLDFAFSRLFALVIGAG